MAPKDFRAYGCRAWFHPVWNRFWLDGGSFALAPGSGVEPTKANRYRETYYSSHTWLHVLCQSPVGKTIWEMPVKTLTRQRGRQL